MIITLNADAVSGDVSDIALYDENGGSVAVSCVQNGNTVTVTPSALSYNTKYTLIIPSDVIGTESDQTVTYTTVWDENAEFVYPAGYSRNDALNVVFFGGSITQQDGWRVYTTNWIKDKFPNANAYSAAVGGTGAEYGWMRLKRDVISKDPDIVFVEYAVNDSTNPKTAQYMESIVRNLNALPKPPVIIFVYTTVLDFNTNTYAIAEHERVAKAYGIPSISIHDYVKSLYDTDPQFASDWDNKLYLPDSTHPTISGTYNGSKIYGDYVTALMGSDSGKYFVKPKKNNMVSALTEYKDYVYDYDITDITLSTVGESYEYSFSGEELVVEYGRGPSKGKFSIEVDGVLIHQSLDAYIQSSVPNMCMPVYGLSSGRHTAKITVLEKNSASSGNEVSLKCMFFADKPSAEFKTPVFDAQALAAGVPLNISYAYTTSQATPVTLWAAAYDTNGKLTSITSLETQTEATGSELSLTLTMTPKAGDTSVKAFIWESLETMKPLAPANELN